MILLSSTVWFFVVLVVVVAGLYATGMVITRRKLARFRSPGSGSSQVSGTEAGPDASPPSASESTEDTPSR